ncbi:hypothetical protein GCM10025866_03360 [Naasia aerilata]|uniref:Uncharacterized protein n=1 Tax=Naasia aerilata TaxID=1162966 RepID=A0ABM8G8C1_9MICO|nr:hypothetical protein GCM10025866_03360 [Naasia aerilata]
MLVAVDERGTLAPGHLDRDDLAVEQARVLRGDRALVRAQGVGVLAFARDPVLLAQHLRRSDVAVRQRVEAPSGALATAGQRVLEHERTGQTAAALLGVVRSVAHRLDAGGEHDVGDAGLHLHRGVHDGLQP